MSLRVMLVGLNHERHTWDHAPSWNEIGEILTIPWMYARVYNTTYQRLYHPDYILTGDIRLDILLKPVPRTLHLHTSYQDHIEYIVEEVQTGRGPFTVTGLAAATGLHPFWIKELWAWQRQRRCRRFIILDDTNLRPELVSIIVSYI